MRTFFRAVSEQFFFFQIILDSFLSASDESDSLLAIIQTVPVVETRSPSRLSPIKDWTETDSSHCHTSHSFRFLMQTDDRNSNNRHNNNNNNSNKREPQWSFCGQSRQREAMLLRLHFICSYRNNPFELSFRV